jgi:hypothetical protein
LDQHGQLEGVLAEAVQRLEDAEALAAGELAGDAAAENGAREQVFAFAFRPKVLPTTGGGVEWKADPLARRLPGARVLAQPHVLIPGNSSVLTA